MLVDSIKIILTQQQIPAIEQAVIKIDEKLGQATQQNTTNPIAMAFSLAPRWVGKSVVKLVPEQHAQLSQYWPNHPLACWRVDQLARCYVLLTASQQLSGPQFEHCFELVFTTSDVSESLLLLQCLPVLPHSNKVMQIARSAARSNVEPIFQALAYDNAYPQQHFDQSGWNQLILKAVFIGCCLNNISGIDQRNNPELVVMLCDYVRERWVAKRDVPYDIWRNIGSLASTTKDLALLQQALTHYDPLTRCAAALGARDNPLAKDLLVANIELNTLLENNQLSWDTLAQQHQQLEQEQHQE